LGCLCAPTVFGTSTLPIENASPSRTTQVLFDPVQKAALMDLYASMGGPFWSYSANGWGGQDPCSWFGVFCNAQLKHVMYGVCIVCLSSLTPATYV
jgi:hypothetical protein